MVIILCSGNFNVKLATAILLSCMVVFQWHYILSIIVEMKNILGIRVFHVKNVDADSVSN